MQITSNATTPDSYRLSLIVWLDVRISRLRTNSGIAILQRDRARYNAEADALRSMRDMLRDTTFQPLPTTTIGNLVD